MSQEYLSLKQHDIDPIIQTDDFIKDEIYNKEKQIKMIKSRQLYRETTFNLPKIKQIQYSPFKSLIDDKRQVNAQEHILEDYPIQIKPTYGLAYNSEFQIIVGGENMYPLFIDVKDQNLVVCSQDCLLVIKIDIHDETNAIHQNTRSFLKSNVKLGVYNKVILNEPPSCIYTTKTHIYLGMNDGKILCYDIVRKNLTGTSDDFSLPIMQLKAVQENSILAIDSAGNIKLVQFSHKTFMDKIIKTLISTKEISVPYKVLKRQKLKNFFSHVINKKNQIMNKKYDVVDNEPKEQNFNKQTPEIGIEGFPYFDTRIQIPDDDLKELLNEDTKILAVYRSNKISIISCTQEFQFIQEQNILENISQKIGMLEFGVGGFQNSNNTHLLLCFSINNKLLYYKGIQVQDSYEWMYISQTLFEHKIIDGKFLSNNLMVLLTQKEVAICNVSQSSQKIHSFNMEKFSYLDFFIQQEGLHFDKKLIAKSILRTITKKSEFFCLQGKRLITGKIDSWKDYLQRYVEEQKFNQAIIMSLRIYNRQLKKLSGINQKQEVRNLEMKQFFEKIALTYISYEIKKQNFDKQNMLSLIIYYLVKTQSYEYLFTTIYQIIKSLNLQEEFIQKIHTFAMKGQIKVMTQELLEIMVDWYKNKDQKDKLQILVQNFDLTLMEKSILLILCLKEHLYQSMIYICNQHNDFISPILKLCGIFFTQNLQNQEKQKIKQILFFHLKECLMGHNTEYGNSKAYIEMLIQIINFIFIPSTLDMLVGISTEDTIKIVNMFFQTKILQFILQNQGQFFIKKNDYVEMKIFQETCINEFKVYEKMLSTMIFILDQKETQKHSEEKVDVNNTDSNINSEKSLYYQVNSFMSYLILKNQLPFEVKYKLESINFFIQTLSFHFSVSNQNYGELNKNILSEKSMEKQQMQMNAYFMRLMDSLLRSIESKQEEQKKKTLNIILNKLQTSRNVFRLLEAQCYILHQLGKYGQVLQSYLNMTNSLLKQKIFSYLQFNLEKNRQLVDEFTTHLDVLFSLNKQKAHDLLKNLNFQLCVHDKIIENLSTFPDVQLEYLEKILKIAKDQNKQNNNPQLHESKLNKYALMHLQIVVKHNPKKLNQYIQKIDYPLEQAFKICEQKSNKTAKAYILIKSGRNIEGLLMLCDIFLKTCDTIFGHLARKRLINQQKKDILDDQLNKLLFSCQKQFQNDNERGQKIWQKCIKRIFKHLRISQNIRNQAIPLPIMSILKQIVYKLMKKMFSQMSPQFFVNKFCRKFPQLPFSVFIIGFGQVFDRMEFYSKLQLLQLEIQQKDESKQMLKMLTTALKSHAVRQNCQICQQNLSFSEQIKWSVVSQSCGCNFHKKCIDRLKTNIKNEQQNKKSSKLNHVCLNQIESFVQMKGVKIEHYKSQHSHEKQIKKRIVKLKDYETNQSCIFDLPYIQV